jgi:hypothetical protein
MKKLADISTFDNLQTKQNENFAQSQMSVFNSNDMKSAKEKFQNAVERIFDEFSNKYGNLGWDQNGRERKITQNKVQQQITVLENAINKEKKRINFTGKAKYNSNDTDEKDIAWAEHELENAKQRIKDELV